MKFPIIKKFSIKNLSLYKEDIDRTVYPGLNMIIGGNGLGKTTMINTILFALVGNAEYDADKTRPETMIDADYFKGRLETKDQETAQVSLTFMIDRREITVVRALYRPRIIRLEVKEANDREPQIYDGDPNRLENQYRNMMQDFLEIGQFEHFVFLVANLLVFGEERQTLMWDEEIQNRVIRLLFSEGDFDEKFDELNEKMTRFDTQGRHLSERRKEIRRAIGRWLQQKEEDSLSDSELQQVERSLAELQARYEAVDEEIAELEGELESELAQLTSLTTEIDQIEMQKLQLEKQLEELENMFYSDVYRTTSPEYALILETLIKRGTCSVCGTSHRSLKALGRSLKGKGQCVVCRSPLKPTEEPQVDDFEDGLSEKINAIREKLDQLDSAYEACNKAQATTNLEIKGIQNSISEKLREQRQLEINLAKLGSHYVIDVKYEEAELSRDIWLERQQEETDKLTEQIRRLYQKRDEAKRQLHELNEELEEILNSVNEELSPLFSHFASRFLGTSCELVVSRRVRRRKPISYVYPRFYDKDRNLITQVSESQRFFLDQAFRMALITWFTEETGQLVFYIVETPEGSLDLAYERNVADMYTEFSNYGHSIIVTSNLNSSNFLRGLYDSLGDDIAKKSERTLDLLQYGHLSDVQKQDQHMEAFNERLQQLGLPLV